VDRVVSGSFEEENVGFVSDMPLNYQCIQLEALPTGSEGQTLRSMGAMFRASAALCGDFRPRCEETQFGMDMCYWDDWVLEIDGWDGRRLELRAIGGRPLPSEYPEPSLYLKDRFLDVQEFSLIAFLADLPSDVQDQLPRWEDGTFAIAEKGEYWNATDVLSGACDPQKGSQHWISGVSGDLAVVFFRSGGTFVLSNVRIMDRQTGDNLTCFVDSTAMREWNGSNHTESLFPAIPTCRTQPPD
jgi:hypothetical protein